MFRETGTREIEHASETDEEEQEKKFETAKKELLDFLNTPYLEVARKSYKLKQLSQEAEQIAQLGYVLEELEDKMLAFATLEPKIKVIEFLKSLLINDRADGSNKPAIFNDAPYPEKDDPNYNTDWRDSDLPTSYKEDYYNIIISALAGAGEGLGADPEVQKAMLDCLKEIDSIAYLPTDGNDDPNFDFGDCNINWLHKPRVKIGKDITEKEFEEKEKKCEGNMKKRTVMFNCHLMAKADQAKYRRREVELFRDGYIRIGMAALYPKSSPECADIESPQIHAIKNLELATRSGQDVLPEFIDYLVTRIKSKRLNYSCSQNFEDIIDILNRNAALAGKKLLHLIQESNEPLTKAIATQMLYRLELGKIGMSKEGVNYLEKVFDLGEYNNPDNFAHRVTADGKIAIFDKENRALGYFQLHDLDSPEKKMKAKMLLFTYETLFRPKKNEKPEERAERLKILEEFKEKYFETYLTDFYKETGVRFNNLNFAEQGWFLWYANNASEKDGQRAKQFIAKYGELGFKTFLSLEHDRQNGDCILAIGENLDQSLAEGIFRKYSSIAGQAEQVHIYLREIFDEKKKYGEEIANSIIENLLSRAKDLLSKFATQIEKEKKQGKTIDNKKILQQLEASKTEIFLFASTFKAISAEQKIDFSDIAGTSLEIEGTNELTTRDKKEMEQIFAENRPGYSLKLLKTTLGEFKEALADPEKKFHLLRHNGQMVAFMRLDQLPSGNLYAGSLNVRPEVRGSAIGSAMLKTVLDQEARNHTIEAVVYEKNPMLKHYLGDFGFKVVEEIPDYEGTGQKFLKIERPREKKITSAKRRAAAWPEAA